MLKKILTFIKKTYPVLTVFLLVIFFFLFYNAYLVDHSVINLRVALNQIAEAKTLEDFQKIKPLLRIPLLKEIAKKIPSSKEIFSLEVVENIINTAKDLSQIEEAKFYLKGLIEAKKTERGAVLSFLDGINTRLFAPKVELSKTKLEAQVNSILTRISSLKDRERLQEAYYDLGNLYTELADLSGAEKAFLETIQINPKSTLAIKAKFNLAWAYKSRQEYEKAVTYFIEVGKEYAAKELAIKSQYEIADIWYKKGEYQKSRDAYAQLASEYPEFNLADLALYEAGYISFYNLGDRETALKYFAQLEEKFPQAKIIQHTLTKVRPVMAAEFCQRGYGLLREKKYPEAIDNFVEAVKIAPLDARSFSGMGLGFYWLDQIQEALDKAKKAVEVSAEDEAAVINSLFIYIKCGRLDEAIKIGEEFLAKGLRKRADFYYNLGCAYLLKQNFDQAIVQFKRAINLEPSFTAAYNNLGYAYWKKRNYPEAIRKFKEAIARDSKCLQAHFNLGIAYFSQNQLEEAYQEFKKVLEIDPNYKQADKYLRRIITTLKYQP